MNFPEVPGMEKTNKYLCVFAEGDDHDDNHRTCNGTAPDPSGG